MRVKIIKKTEHHTVVSRSTCIYSTGGCSCQEPVSINNDSFFESFLLLLLLLNVVPLIPPFDDFDVNNFLRFLTNPHTQNIMHTVIAAAIKPNAAYTLPGNSRSFLVVPHSSSDSSCPDGQFGRPLIVYYL